MTFTTPRIFLIACAAGLFNIFPLFLGDLGGDVFFHYALIDCFGKQFWQGDFYPRWCMEANGGFGSPAFIFYYPMPYLLTSLLYPLHFFGVDTEGLFMASVLAANIITFLTCYLWLKETISPGRAMLCALAYLFMPYRMKLMMLGSAFAELWCLAWIPLLFFYTTRMARGKIDSWLPLACTITLSMLTHISATFFGLIACGLQLLFFTGKAWKPKYLLGICAAIAVIATSFYWVPAMHFRPYLNPEAMSDLRTVSANRYITLQDILHGGFMRQAAIMALTLAVMIGLGIACLRRRKRLPDNIRKQMELWFFIGLLGAILCSSLSAPIWDLFDYVHAGILPWRAQALTLYSAVFLLAVKSQWLTEGKQLSTWKGDYSIFILLIIMISLLYFTVRVPMEGDYYERIEKAHIIGAQEYRTRWTDRDKDIMKMVDDLVNRTAESGTGIQAEFAKGRGHIKVESDDYRGIVLSTDSASAAQIRIEHFYFPTWNLLLDDKPSDALTAELHSGFMLADIPPGKHTLRIVRNLGSTMGIRYPLAMLCSLITIAGLALLSLRRRKQRVVIS